MNPRQPKQVLVVDDDESAVVFVHTALDPQDYEVEGVSDGLAGLSRAQDKVPDLIILDVYMPRQVGFYTLQDLKADPRTKHIPIVMLTSVGKRMGITYSTQDLYDFLGIEPDAYLEKPVDPMFLRQVVDRLLGSDSAADGEGSQKE